MALRGPQTAWWKEDNRENANVKLEMLARAYQYILSDQWGKGTPIPWLEKEKERDKQELK